MDVNFSQIGQNFAQQDNASANAANLEQQRQQVAIAPAEEATRQSGQENLNDADNRESRGQDSLNNESIEIESAVNEISEFLQATNRQLAFSVDEKSERSVVKVTDSVSGEVIRQIPSEEVLALSERIKELQADVGSAVGVLFNKQV
ncbi:flagellar protein FlaG [Aliiglaciecola sp. M165]|uniref:flagellar protein FlaG n=1 Tax=Aliiglaciecola sp. M165 TaxID=2593649 RepID=UPI00117ECEB9|nr:flagellar protein FlaG [Aliiglaciecola sp. M165]TRY30924.1 flagellar protein FlaG [Aliiglaciecola sp. M165]